MRSNPDYLLKSFRLYNYSKVIIFSFLECQKEYPSKHTLKIHLWSEHNIGKDISCVCTLCGEVKTTKYGLKQHMKAKHEG